MARANGIPASDVYEVDESRQSSRVSANVSGFGKTQRISLNDNLLQRCTPEEIVTTMGHEMGHYVLNHIYKSILFLRFVLARRLRIPELEPQLVPRPLGRALGNRRHHRRGRPSAGRAAVVDFLLRDTRPSATPGRAPKNTKPTSSA